MEARLSNNISYINNKILMNHITSQQVSLVVGLAGFCAIALAFASCTFFTYCCSFW
jgi:hypothetical protein